MKKVYYSLLMVAMAAMAVSCNKVSYKKTKSGMLYKIISSSTKDSVVKEGNWLKIYFVQKLNDSVLQTNYGKMPIYQKLATNPNNVYNPSEIFHLLRKGDSAVTILFIDSILKKGIAQESDLPPFMKKGNRLVLSLRVADVFRDDSLQKKDFDSEMVKDAPRQRIDQEEQAKKQEVEREKYRKEMQAKRAADEVEWEKSGEIAKELKEMEAYLRARNITAQKFGKGTYVFVKEQGTGPQAEQGKFVTVKYTGKLLKTDSVFQSNVYPFKLGAGEVIPGWDDGLVAFKQGGKGTVYVTGFKAYAKDPRPGSPFGEFEPLVFDVEMLNVSDTLPKQAPVPLPPSRR